MSLYQDLILDHYKNPRNFGPLQKPDRTATINNPLCGDRVQLDLKIQQGKVTEVSFSGEGCAISTASASMLTEQVKDKKISDLRKWDKSFILKMLGIDLTPNRLKCALLPLEALHKVISNSKD